MSDNTLITEGKPIGYRDVFQQKQYMKMIFANIINRFGDSIDAIAFTWLVYALTNSAGWSAVIFGINKLPTIFLQPFAGALVENMNKKVIMVLTDIIRGICVCLVAVMFILDILNPWILIVVTLIISGAEAFRGPAGTAIMPRILDKECYDFGLSLNSSLSSVVELIGLASAGAIIALFGTQTAILIDAVTFFVSALIITLIRSGEENIVYKKIDYNEYLQTLKGGFTYIKSKRIILNYILLAIFANGILVPLNSLMAPLVRDLLRQEEYLLSVLSLTLTIGMAVGSALYPYVVKKMRTNKIVFLCGMMLSVYYFTFVVCGYLSTYTILIYVVITVTSFITGTQISLLISSFSVQFMKRVETEYLARAGSILSAGCVGSIPIVSFLISILTSMISLAAIFCIISGICFVGFVFIFIRKVEFE